MSSPKRAIAHICTVLMILGTIVSVLGVTLLWGVEGSHLTGVARGDGMGFAALVILAGFCGLAAGAVGWPD